MIRTVEDMLTDWFEWESGPPPSDILPWLLADLSLSTNSCSVSHVDEPASELVHTHTHTHSPCLPNRCYMSNVGRHRKCDA